jgi:hypothetical protein
MSRPFPSKSMAGPKGGGLHWQTDCAHLHLSGQNKRCLVARADGIVHELVEMARVKNLRSKQWAATDNGTDLSRPDERALRSCSTQTDDSCAATPPRLFTTPHKCCAVIGDEAFRTSPTNRMSTLAPTCFVLWHRRGSTNWSCASVPRRIPCDQKGLRRRRHHTDTLRTADTLR